MRLESVPDVIPQVSDHLRAFFCHLLHGFSDVVIILVGHTAGRIVPIHGRFLHRLQAVCTKSAISKTVPDIVTENAATQSTDNRAYQRAGNSSYAAESTSDGPAGQRTSFGTGIHAGK